MMRKNGLLLALLMTVPHPVMGASEDQKLRDARSAWIIVPAENAPDTVMVHKGDMVLRQKLLPFGYAVTNVDAVDGDSPQVLVPAGTDMLRLVTASGILECSINAAKKTPFEKFNMSGEQIRYCLRDKDGDGRFEEYVRYRGSFAGMPSFDGRLPHSLYPLKAQVPYTVRRPEDLQSSYFVGIKYEGNLSAREAVDFSIVFGHDSDWDTLGGGWPHGDGGDGDAQATGRMMLGGARFVVLTNDDSGATVRVVAPFPDGALGITQHGTNGFF